jgi:preprotein translocase subunit SecY
MNIPIEKIAKYLPAVEKPTYKQNFNTKLIWTGVALLLYFLLSEIKIFGTGVPPAQEYVQTIQLLLGAKLGSLMTLGIGPVVTAGILLQLVVGAKIINWDMNKSEGREKFQTWNKFLSIIFCFLTAFAYTIAGAVPVLAGVGNFIIVILQLAMGGIIVILLDELVSKWGFGSGISLFIAAGVGRQIFISLFSPFAPNPNPLLNPGPFTGSIWNFFSNVLAGLSSSAFLNFLPMLSTILVFIVTVYIQNIAVDIPLAFSAMRGFGRSWSLKLLYTSNIPVILAAALIANLQLMGRFGYDPKTLCSYLACYDTAGNVKGGVIYYLTSPRNLLGDAFRGTLTSSEGVRAVTYLIFLSLAAMIFSVFWISTSSMDAGSVAEQIESIGMQIPGYRRDKKTMEGVLQRYIPPLALMGGLIVGLVAALADFTGALGTGTGILLTVMIIYNYYEQLSNERLEEAHPLVRKVLGE